VTAFSEAGDAELWRYNPTIRRSGNIDGDIVAENKEKIKKTKESARPEEGGLS
jgi:hypothetical protein